MGACELTSHYFPVKSDVHVKRVSDCDDNTSPLHLVDNLFLSRETLFPYFSIISAALPVGARSDLVRQGTNRPLYCLIRHKVERGVGEGVIKQLQVNSAKHTSLDSEFGRNLPVGRRWEFIYVMKGFILRPRGSVTSSDGRTH